MDVLLIPVWRRAEFLHFCLDNLVKTGDLATVHIVLKPDSGHSSETIEMIDRWAPQLPSWEIASCLPSRNPTTKQSLNLLSGYLYAAKQSTGLVWMIEEDVMVGRDFFKYHRALHKQERLFCSLSTRNHNRSVGAGGNSSNYYLSTNDFCSLGVVFRREVIEDHIAPHVNDNYLQHPRAYCDAYWPEAKEQGIHPGHVEQDGLIRRIQTTSDLPTAYPCVPRAFHAGWYGYNRHRSVDGPLNKRIETVGRTIYDPAAMRKASINDAWYRDSQPEPLELEQWERLQRIQP